MLRMGIGVGKGAGKEHSKHREPHLQGHLGLGSTPPGEQRPSAAGGSGRPPR